MAVLFLILVISCIIDDVLLIISKFGESKGNLFKRIVFLSDYFTLIYSTFFFVYMFTIKNGIYSTSMTRAFLGIFIWLNNIFLFIQIIQEYKYGMKFLDTALENIVVSVRIIVFIFYIAIIIIGSIPRANFVKEKSIEVEKRQFEKIEFVGAIKDEANHLDKCTAIVTLEDTEDYKIEETINLSKMDLDKIYKFEDSDTSDLESVRSNVKEEKYICYKAVTTYYESLLGIKKVDREIKTKIHTNDINEYAFIKLLKD